MTCTLTCLVAPQQMADDWPHWMGPNRDDVWAETGIVEELPSDGLEFRW